MSLEHCPGCGDLLASTPPGQAHMHPYFRCPDCRKRWGPLTDLNPGERVCSDCINRGQQIARQAAAHIPLGAATAAEGLKIGDVGTPTKDEEDEDAPQTRGDA